MSKNYDEAFNFLFFTYLGVTTDVDDEKILNAIINRAYRDASSHVLSVDGGNENVRNNGSMIISDAIKEYSTSCYNDWHTKICRKLISLDQSMTYGIAQKWLNMTMKYLWLFDKLPSEISEKDLHIPIDSHIIDALWSDFSVKFPYKTEKTNRCYNYKKPSDYVKGWSTWIESDYCEFRNNLNTDIYNIEWENKIWIEMLKK